MFSFVSLWFYLATTASVVFCANNAMHLCADDSMNCVASFVDVRAKQCSEVIRDLETLFAGRLYDHLRSVETMLGDFHVNDESFFQVIQPPENSDESITTFQPTSVKSVKNEFGRALEKAHSTLTGITASIPQSKCDDNSSSQKTMFNVVLCSLGHFSTLISMGKKMIEEFVIDAANITMIAPIWHRIYRIVNAGFGRSWNAWKELAINDIELINGYVSEAMRLVKTNDIEKVIRQLAIDCSKNPDKNISISMLQTTVKDLLKLVNGKMKFETSSSNPVTVDEQGRVVFVEVAEAMRNIGMTDSAKFLELADDTSRVLPLSRDRSTFEFIVSISKAYLYKLDRVLMHHHPAIISKYMENLKPSTDNDKEYAHLMAAFEHSLQVAHSWNTKKLLIDHVLEQGLRMFVGLFRIYEGCLGKKNFLQEIAMSLSMSRFSLWGVSLEGFCKKYKNYGEFSNVFRIVTLVSDCVTFKNGTIPADDPIPLHRCVESLLLDAVNSNEVVRMAMIDSFQRTIDHS